MHVGTCKNPITNINKCINDQEIVFFSMNLAVLHRFLFTWLRKPDFSFKQLFLS